MQHCCITSLAHTKNLLSSHKLQYQAGISLLDFLFSTLLLSVLVFALMEAQIKNTKILQFADESLKRQGMQLGIAAKDLPKSCSSYSDTLLKCTLPRSELILFYGTPR